jgi:ABC-2 type transport system ATP-binding protein
MNEIRIENITKTYATKEKHTVVNNLSLTIKEGTVFGFLGPNGAGKTSTIKMLVGLSKPTSGTISILGGTPDDIAVRKHIGFMPESPAFYLYLTGYEFLEFVANIFGIKFPRHRIETVLQEVDLMHACHRQIRTYSKGMLQRIGIAQALLHDPELIFLDEPMSGLDPVGRKLIKDLMIELKAAGKTIFFNTHILSDVEAICDRFGIIIDGSLVADMQVDELTESLEDFFMKKVEEVGVKKVE